MTYIMLGVIASRLIEGADATFWAMYFLLGMGKFLWFLMKEGKDD